MNKCTGLSEKFTCLGKVIIPKFLIRVCGPPIITKGPQQKNVTLNKK